MSELEALRSSAPDAYVVLDDDDRIVHVSRPFHDTRGRGAGHVPWDHLPHAREI
jgi:PAS domain-containing protein